MTHEQIIQVLQEFSVETDHGYYELHGILFDRVAEKIMKLYTTPQEDVVTQEMADKRYKECVDEYRKEGVIDGGVIQEGIFLLGWQCAKKLYKRKEQP